MFKIQLWPPKTGTKVVRVREFQKSSLLRVYLCVGHILYVFRLLWLFLEYRPRHETYLICFWHFYAQGLMSGQGQMEVIDINNIDIQIYSQFVYVPKTNATFLKFVYLSQQKLRKFAKLLNVVNNSVYFNQTLRKILCDICLSFMIKAKRSQRVYF